MDVPSPSVVLVVAPMSHHEQLSIFDIPVTARSSPPPRRDQPAARPVRGLTNDMDLIESVISAALEPGYVVIGPAERVWRRVASSDGRTDGRIERVPDYEDHAVHQLLDQALFTIGRALSVYGGAYEGRASMVCVSADTARMLRRWRSYLPGPRAGGGSRAQS
jgi:hypothetical protein